MPKLVATPLLRPARCVVHPPVPHDGSAARPEAAVREYNTKNVLISSLAALYPAGRQRPVTRGTCEIRRPETGSRNLGSGGRTRMPDRSPARHTGDRLPWCIPAPLTGPVPFRDARSSGPCRARCGRPVCHHRGCLPHDCCRTAGPARSARTTAGRAPRSRGAAGGPNHPRRPWHWPTCR